MTPADDIRRQIGDMLDDMDALRERLLRDHGDDAELRGQLRRVIGGLEQIRARRFVSEDHHDRLLGLLSRFLDAEHGAMLRKEADDATLNAVSAHAERQARLLAEARQDIPAVHRALDRCISMLGQKPDEERPLADKHHALEAMLRRHLTGDAQLRREFARLLEALQSSLDAMNRLVEDIGEEAPELQEARRLLEAELPDDAETAREILARAREGLLSAGGKLARAGERLRQTMQSHVEQMQSLSRKLDEAEREARHDPLTGLANRRALADFLKSLGDRGFCFVLLDIDHFKQINDTHGHDAGDEVLAQLAGILREHTRSTDLAARLGGEEFCVVFPDTDLANGERLAEALREAIARHPFDITASSIGARTLEVTVSIGVAEHRPGQPHARAIKAADRALYAAKKAGRNRVRTEKQLAEAV